MKHNGKGRNGLKKLNEAEEFPRDFWNYSVNPITGFLYTIRSDEARRSKSKYFKTYNELQQ